MSEIHIPDILTRHPKIILFDGVCHLCSGNVKFIFKRDRTESIMFCPVQSSVGSALLQHFGLPTNSHETVVFIEDGRALLKSDAVINMWRHLQFPWPLLTIAKYCPARIRDAFYLTIARNRYRWFGMSDICMIPDEKLARRFIS